MGKASGLEEPPWHSQAAAVKGLPEQHRCRFLEARLRERARKRRRRLLGVARGAVAVVVRRRHPLGAARGTAVEMARRRRLLDAQLGVLIDGEGKPHVVHHGVAEQLEDDLAEIGVGDLKATKVLCMENVDDEAGPEENTAIYLCLSVSSITQEPRIVWFLLNNGAGVIKGKNIHCIMPVSKCTHLPKIGCFHLDEMEESVSDHQFPRSLLITNNSEDSPQQVHTSSKSNTGSQQDGDACRSQNVPIFIRHCSGLVVLTLNLDESLEHMMNLYEQKTGTKLAHRYFSYQLKRIEPEHTLRFYGIERNATVHLCGRLLVGMTDTLEKYVSDNGENFSVYITFPDGNVLLDMTKQGCLILSTLLKCFTHTFARPRSWNGNITMNDFKVTDGHVRIIKSAEEDLNSISLQADLKILVYIIRKIFYKGSYPPYVNGLISFLQSLRSSFLSEDDKLFIETHMSCLESFARGMLLIKLRKKYKSLPPSKKKIWNGAIEGLDKGPRRYPSVAKLSKVIVFDDIIRHAKDEKKAYTWTRSSTFRLMRDEFMHGPSNRFNKSVNPWKEKFKNDNGIELMVPAKYKNLLPTTIRRLIKAEGIDIKKELLAAQVKCTCPLCHPYHLEMNKVPLKKKKTQDGGESSKQGGEPSKHGGGSLKGATDTASPSQKAISSNISLRSSKGVTQTELPSQEATSSSEGSEAKTPSFAGKLKNATAKASPQKLQPSRLKLSSSQDMSIPKPSSSQERPKPKRHGGEPSKCGGGHQRA